MSLELTSRHALPSGGYVGVDRALTESLSAKPLQELECLVDAYRLQGLW
jgi:hypothetical protein